MHWLSLLPTALVALGLIFLPGLVAFSTWKLRLFTLLAISPMISIADLGLSAIVADQLGYSWGLVWVFPLPIGLALTGWGLGRYLSYPPSNPETKPNETALKAGINRPDPKLGGSKRIWHFFISPLAQQAYGWLLSLYFLGRKLLYGLIGPDHFLQHYDNGFHLNAITHVAFHGGGSSLNFKELGQYNFYPAGWHDWAGLAAKLTPGSNALVATQACVLITCLLVWPITIGFLAETLFNLNWVGRLTIGALSLISPTFPFGFLTWGPLLPNLLGMALGPALFMVLWQLLIDPRRTQFSPLTALVVGFFGVLGTGIGHSNVLVAILALVGIPWFITQLSNLANQPFFSFGDFRDKTWWKIFVSLSFTGAFGLWAKISLSLTWNSTWPANSTIGQTLGETLTGTAVGVPPSKLLACLIPLGLFILLRGPKTNLLIFSSFVSAAILYIGTYGVKQPLLQTLISGLFYSDSHRTGAIPIYFTVPLAAFALSQLWEKIEQFLSAKLLPALRPVFTVRLLGAGLAFVTVFTASIEPLFDYTIWVIRNSHQFNRNSQYLTSEELSFVKELPKYLPKDTPVINNPWQGSGLIYTFSDLKPTAYYLYGPNDASLLYVTKHLNRLASDPAVCKHLQKVKTPYVLVLEPHYVENVTNQKALYQGLTKLDQVPGIKVVAQKGKSTLFKVTGCGVKP